MLSKTRDQPGVLLVSMPWGPSREPCLGLSILKRVLRNNGVPCEVLHTPMQLLRYIKVDTLDWIAGVWGANDFVFTREFEDQISPEQQQALHGLVRDWQDCLAAFPRTLSAPDAKAERIVRLRQEIIPRFLDDLMAETDFSQYSLVGFSCLFDQTFASLALARRIRRAYPGIMIAFGGYALQRPVGPALQKCFPEMDVVAYGDGEPAILPLWRAACGLGALSDVPNISYRNRHGDVVDENRVVKIDMDDSPAPDYDDFFVQREELNDRHKVTFVVGELQVESSRGCWFGQKSHCTFCGIDDDTLKYRVKSTPVVVSQLDELHKRYNASVFRFSDYIMPLQNYHDFLPEMARRGAPYQLHYETKANLTESQIELCARAGIRFLQPGIESFSSPLLKLMAKGVSAAQNVFTLYTMLRHGIFSFYNLIFGFPFETPESYEQMIKLLPALYHLIPPQTTLPVLVTRYAPLATDPRRFGSEAALHAHWRYDVIFSERFRSENGVRNEDFCYYYESPYRQFESKLKTCHDILQHQVANWKERYESRNARLTFQPDEEGMVVRDTRASDQARLYRFGRVHRSIGEVMQRGIFGLGRLVQELEKQGIAGEETRPAIEELLEARVVIQVEAQLVWLAHPEGAFERTCDGLHRLNTEVVPAHEWRSLEEGQQVLQGSGPRDGKQYLPILAG